MSGKMRDILILEGLDQIEMSVVLVTFDVLA